MVRFSACEPGEGIGFQVIPVQSMVICAYPEVASFISDQGCDEVAADRILDLFGFC